jgi:hypothetical protein
VRRIDWAGTEASPKGPAIPRIIDPAAVPHESLIRILGLATEPAKKVSISHVR